MEYKKICTCPNDCILYHKKFVIPTKVLWCNLLIPRFKCLLWNHEHAKNLICYNEERIKYDKL